MLSSTNGLSGITHPLIASMHMRKDYSNQRYQDVLVIEAAFPHDDAPDGKSFDSYLEDLLTDLEGLTYQAQDCVGTFDRVDICTH